MYTGYSPYGWRARIGLIVPSTNVTMEPEFHRMAPEGVSVHVSRVMLRGKVSVESHMEMAVATERATVELATAEPNVIAYGCTAGSIVGGDEAITERMQGASGGIPVVTTGTAVVEALRALGLKRIAVATPYVQWVNDEEKIFLEQRGFEVTRILGLEMGHTEADRKSHGRLPSGVPYRIAREADTPDAEGVFVSCTNFPTVPVIEQLETDLGKPVVCSNQATFWAALRRAGLKDRVEGVGKLLRER